MRRPPQTGGSPPPAGPDHATQSTEGSSPEHTRAARRLAKRESWLDLLRRTLRLAKGRPKSTKPHP